MKRNHNQSNHNDICTRQDDMTLKPFNGDMNRSQCSYG